MAGAALTAHTAALSGVADTKVAAAASVSSAMLNVEITDATILSRRPRRFERCPCNFNPVCNLNPVGHSASLRAVFCAAVLVVSSVQSKLAEQLGLVVSSLTCTWRWMRLNLNSTFCRYKGDESPCTLAYTLAGDARDRVTFVGSIPFARTCNAATWLHVCQDGR